MKKNKNNRYVKRPLVVGTLFYILGLIGGELHCDIVQFSLFFLIVLIIVIGMYAYYNNMYVGVYLLIACLGIGSIIFNPILKEEKMFSNNNGAKISVQGKVLEVKEYEYQNQYIVKPNKVFLGDQSTKLEGLIKVEAKKEFKTVKQGDIITTSGKIESLSFPRNPGAFNERTYLLIRSVTTKLKAQTLNVDIENKKIPIFQKLRNYYGVMFETVIPWNEAQIMKAMLIGDKSFLSKEIQELYKDVGIAHVLAISGLHISVIASVLWWILRRTGLNKNSQSMVIVVILWMYAGFTCFSISITRSVIMMTAIIIATLLQEKSDAITSWGFAALALLLYNNLYLWDIGFQLSFVAVGSLILLTPFFNKIFVIPMKIRSHIAPLIAVTVGTTPIIAYYYYVVSPIGIVANLLLIPLITIVVIIGFIAMLICPINILLAKWVMGSAYYLLVIIEKSSALVLGIPFSTVIVGRPDMLELMIYMIFLASILWYLHISLEQRKGVKKYIIPFCTVLSVLVCVKKTVPKDLMVTFLDVGQGDCIVITTPYHKTFIIDGGRAGNGKKIEQFLKYNGIKKVDGVILSHTHSDHMDGLKELVMSYTIDKVLLTELPLEETSFREFYDIIKSKGIPIYKLSSQDSIRHRDIVIECMYPFEKLPSPSGNDASAVLVLRHGMVSYYFTGDIEGNYEKEVSFYLQKNFTNILKVPHHGSSTSSTQELITNVKPDVAIISCGKNNIYKHPHKDVVDRYKENNVPMLITKDVGAITTYSNNKTVKMYTMEDKGMLWK